MAAWLIAETWQVMSPPAKHGFPPNGRFFVRPRDPREGFIEILVHVQVHDWSCTRQ